MSEPTDPAKPGADAAPAELTPTAPFQAAGGTRASPADTATGGPRRRILVILGPVATIILILPAVIGLAARHHRSASPAGVSAIGLGAPTDTTYPTAPTANVQRIHSALHDMGARCTAHTDPAARAQIGRDVAELITFAKTYPNARFTVDGENGRALDLLLIARDEMRDCAPAAAARANQELPAQYRATPSPSLPAATGSLTGR